MSNATACETNGIRVPNGTSWGATCALVPGNEDACQTGGPRTCQPRWLARRARLSDAVLAWSWVTFRWLVAHCLPYPTHSKPLFARKRADPLACRGHVWT